MSSDGSHHEESAPLLQSQNVVASEREAAMQTILKDSAMDPMTEEEKLSRTRQKHFMGAVYMGAMGVCGLVLVALGATLTYLANMVSKESTALGTVFLARGIGAVSGAISSAKLYKWFSGNFVMAAGLCLITAIMIALIYNTSVVMLHVYFGGLGIATAVVDTGVQIMTRKLHGKDAGPWLGANTVSFGCAGALVPLIEVIIGNTQVEFFVLAVLVGLVAAGMVVVPTVEEYLAMNRSRENMVPPPRPKQAHYNVEIVISMMVFLYIGGKVTLTGYLYTYIEDTGVIDSNYETTALLVLWISITIGRLSGVYDQAYVNNTTLPWHLFVLSVGASLSMLTILVFPHRGIALWVCLGFFGIFNGPCVGYCYDMNNRLTAPSEESMAIVMLGLNMGASLVPWITASVWTITGNPYTLIWAGFLSNAVPILPIFFLKGLSYDPLVNPYLKRNQNEHETDSEKQINA